jgi:hypothetical protein
MTRRSDGLRSALLAVRHRNPSIAAPSKLSQANLPTN